MIEMEIDIDVVGEFPCFPYDSKVYSRVDLVRDFDATREPKEKMRMQEQITQESFPDHAPNLEPMSKVRFGRAGQCFRDPHVSSVGDSTYICVFVPVQLNTHVYVHRHALLCAWSPLLCFQMCMGAVTPRAVHRGQSSRGREYLRARAANISSLARWPHSSHEE